MSSLAILNVIRPKWLAARHRIKEERSRSSGGKILTLAVVGLLFWAAVYGVLFRILRYFSGVEEIGQLLAAKLLGVTLLAFFGILLLSNVITALSTFFLAKDLDLLASSPVDWLHLYLSKLGETIVHSSWMVALMAVPIFAAYGVVFGGGLLFIPFALAVFLPFLILPGVVGSAVTLTLVNLFPARRTRDLLAIIAIGAAGLVILLFRIMRPEQLARPEGFQSLLDFITLLRTPSSPFLPSEWAAQTIMGYLTGRLDLLPAYLLWTTAAGFIVLGALLHAKLYPLGFTKAQEGAEKFIRAGIWNRLLRSLFFTLPVAKREFVVKDIKLFFRDTTQWSQLILLGVLVVVYVFNIRALPLFRGEQVPFFFVTLVSFLNMGLAGFVLAAIAARFIFPSVSLEGRQMWLLRSSPLDLRTLMWSKYWTGAAPLLVVAVVLIVATNIILRASPFMMVVSVGTIMLLTLAISALALSFGALFPQFDTENAAQIPTSFGGLLFMMTTIALLALVIIMEARPVSVYLQLQREGGGALTITQYAWLAGVAVVCGTVTFGSLALGRRRVEQLDF